MASTGEKSTWIRYGLLLELLLIRKALLGNLKAVYSWLLS